MLTFSFIIGSVLLAGGELTKAVANKEVCDLVDAEDGVECVAAHSITRVLYANYRGPLYTVQRADGKTMDIGVIEKGTTANVAVQDEFCRGQCYISKIFDQSKYENHLYPAPAGGAGILPDKMCNASRFSTTLGASSQKVYGAYFGDTEPINTGYRNTNTTGVATGDLPETMYMVVDGTHYNAACCFDYGNAEIDSHDDGKGTMEAVYWGNSSGWGRGKGNGPWVMADLENGLWAGSGKENDQNVPIQGDFVMAMVKGKAGGFALKGGDVGPGSSNKLTKLYEGQRPPNYDPMKKQGSIILGIGGDNSDWAVGTFFEGVMTRGYTSDDLDNAIFASIVSAKYGN